MLDRIAQHGARHAAGIADLCCGYHRGVAGESFPGAEPGLSGCAELVVGDEHTAPRVGSGKVHVLATPVMINLIEAAALAAIEPRLPKGYQSLGTRLEVRHIAATPVGMKVMATAVVTKVESRTVTFRVEARG